MSNKHRKFVLPLCMIGMVLVCILFVILFLQWYKMNFQYTVTNDQLLFEQVTPSPANSAQKNTSVHMFVCKNNPYFLIRLGKASSYNDTLCTIENGELHIIAKISHLYGADEDYIYYRLNDSLISYDVDRCLPKKIQQVTVETNKYLWLEDRTLQVLIDEKCNKTAYIKNGSVQSTSNETQRDEYEINTYSIASGTYSTYANNKLLHNGRDISDQLGDSAHRSRYLVPFNDGLLVINDGYENLIYFIDSQGNIKSLFPEFPCLCATSSVTCYDNYVFLSFRRYEDWGPLKIDLKRFENDTIEGTYRIDIRDNSIFKISDETYKGMYIFDDSGIYVSDFERGFSKIDFDGNQILSIIR